ncbi:SRPBCC domain-containing protein [Paenibacillus sp. GD4]|jgi:uncharacterized protein YndB with AHSA1/START domain|uniref:SRPBCC family protein n=1 Tax=Paenibacillus sp. GD4 TaxID=3068890 RepID=UPI002796A2D0|nr:SRPBCC domain-containing protein [Paenibacillus sp. GD4]MDQ1910741.1 SRPBCC domain-containing protein [Paenibacillus sp. GD4]
MPQNDQATLPDIRQTIELKAPLQKVWAAVSSSEGIEKWFMPNDFQPELGYEFTLRSPYENSPCKVIEINPPHLLVFTWGEDWVITFELKEIDGGTEFTLIHSGWIAGKTTVTGDTHNVIRDRMNGGWSSAVLPRLKAYVEA